VSEICRQPWRSIGNRRSARQHTGRQCRPRCGPDPRRRSPEVGTERPSFERHAVLIEIGQSALSTLAPGSHPSMWSKERFSIIKTTTVSNGAAAGAGSGLLTAGRRRGGVAAFDLNPRPSAARLAASARTLWRVDFQTIPSPLWRCPWRSGLSAVTHPVLQARVNQLICSVRKVLGSLLLSGETGLQPPEYHSPARSADDHCRCSAEDALPAPLISQEAVLLKERSASFRERG